MVRPLKWAQMKLKKNRMRKYGGRAGDREATAAVCASVGRGAAVTGARCCTVVTSLHFLSSVPPCAFSAGRSGVETALLRSYRKLAPGDRCAAAALE